MKYDPEVAQQTAQEVLAMENLIIMGAQPHGKEVNVRLIMKGDSNELAEALAETCIKHKDLQNLIFNIAKRLVLKQMEIIKNT